MDAPVAVNTALSPGQTVALFTVTVRPAFRVMLTLPVAVQPLLELVTVTEYVVGAETVAVVEAAVLFVTVPPVQE